MNNPQLFQLLEKISSGRFNKDFQIINSLSEWDIFIYDSRNNGKEKIHIDSIDIIKDWEKEGYLNLIKTHSGYKGSFTKRGSEYYKLLVNQNVIKNNNYENALVTNFEDQWNIDLLRKSFNNCRLQAQSYHFATLIIMLTSLFVLITGILMYFRGTNQMDTAKFTSIGGFLGEIITILFFRQTKNANKRQDMYHKELIDMKRYLNILKLLDEDYIPQEKRIEAINSLIDYNLGIKD